MPDRSRGAGLQEVSDRKTKIQRWNDTQTGDTEGSDYRKYLSGQVFRIWLKIDENRRLFWDFFSSTKMNDLTMTVTSWHKPDAKYVNQQ